MGVDFLIRRVLDHRAGDGRKLASGHEYPLCQGVASGHPKGRSAAKEPRSGLTRRDVLTPRPTSCGSSRVLFAIYARIYAAVNMGNRLNLGVLMKDGRKMISLVRTDYIGWEIDRFFRASKSAMPCIATIGQRLFDKIEGTSWEDAEPVPNTVLRRLVVECPLFPGRGSIRYDHSFLALKQEMREEELKGVGAPYSVYHIVRDIQLFGLHHNQVAKRTMGRTRQYFTPDMVDAVRKQKRGVVAADDGE